MPTLQDVMRAAIVSLVHHVTHSAPCLGACLDWIWNTLLKGLCQAWSTEGIQGLGFPKVTGSEGICPSQIDQPMDGYIFWWC